jgi:hypothetical protein
MPNTKNKAAPTQPDSHPGLMSRYLFPAIAALLLAVIAGLWFFSAARNLSRQWCLSPKP